MPSLISLFFGTRPQIIKASVLREALAGIGPVMTVDTGQHYDFALHQVHYDQLSIGPPDAFLGVGSGSHARQTGTILEAAERCLHDHPPTLAIVIGDTNSTLACALAAAKARIPVAHVEAGLRAVDFLMAEEINRRCVDAVSTLLFAPSIRAVRALEREGVRGEIHQVGDVAYDVLLRHAERAPAVRTIRGYSPSWGEDYVFVTLHRAELVDHPSRLATVVGALRRLERPVWFAAHPRTHSALESAGITPGCEIAVCEPLGYVEGLAAVRHAAVVVTDSGGLQREAYWLGTPCVTMRNETEWVETVELGANRVVPPERAELELPSAIRRAVQDRAGGRAWDRTAYGGGGAAGRVAEIVAAALGSDRRSR